MDIALGWSTITQKCPLTWENGGCDTSQNPEPEGTF
jgi:hypothetical protein